MNAATITIGTIAAALSIVCWAFFLQGVWHTVRQIFLGQRSDNRFTPVIPRTATLFKEVALHTRMNRFRTVGWAHWLVMVGFLLGSILWFEAYGQTFDPEFHWPVIGAWKIYLFADEVLGLGTVIGITALITIRQLNHPRRAERLSRFGGSRFKAAYFVEAVVLLEGLGMIFVKTFKIAAGVEDPPIWTSFFTHYFAIIFEGIPSWVVCIAAVVKLMSGMVWLAVVGRNITWGVAWHRFSAFFNIYLKRMPDGAVALGAARPMMSAGKVIDMEDADPDVDTFGAGKIEDFTWKGWLDFATCTECGRCQSQCPAWNTGKPLTPKMLITSLRDHADAKAPYLLAGGRKDMAGDEVGLVDAEGNVQQDKLDAIPAAARAEAERPLVGASEGTSGGGVIDPDVLWSCTTCGACVEQCPVDIEHVDHIIDMRRYQVLIESDFPTELAGLFKNLENKGNPWGQNSKDRTNWIDEVDIEIPVFGEDVDTFAGFEYLFWVGCAGAYEDRAKRTTKAVAELLDIAAVDFLVLGQGETCTGDSARRAGNEFLFQMLAQQNIETFDELFATAPQQRKKIVVTCAHCLNALRNEYPQLGADYEVVHHTQLLNRLVREKRLIPVAPLNEGVTYHDPCYLGRHNKVYEPPRDLMDASGSQLTEMPRHNTRSMCCGAGGARMWMEESIGKRINLDRVDEALSTLETAAKPEGETQKIATGCPFCRVMLTDGVTARTSGTEKEGTVEVVDVAQLLLESVKRGAPEVTRSGRFLGAASLAATGGAAAAAGAATVTEDKKDAKDAGTEGGKDAAKQDAAASSDTATKAPAKKATGTGFGMGGGKKPASKPGADEKATDKDAPAKPAKPAASGFGMGAAKKPSGPSGTGGDSADTPAKPATKGFGMGAGKKPSGPTTADDSTAAETDEKPAAPAAPKAKGFGIGAGKKPSGPTSSGGSATADSSDEASPAPTAKAKGFGMGAGKKPSGPSSTSPAEDTATTEDRPRPEAATDDGTGESAAAPAAPKAKGFGIGAGKKPSTAAGAAAGAGAAAATSSAPEPETATTEPASQNGATGEATRPDETPSPQPAKPKGFGMAAGKKPSTANGRAAAPSQPAEPASTPCDANGSEPVVDTSSDGGHADTDGTDTPKPDTGEPAGDSAPRGFGIAAGKKKPGSSR
ncbi:(Fe-S)-binding protein [Williamsia sterculiae]|uniref:Fe-S oxidoreductase n=1 Tax=Williamsia sterculiae TaxID=1344003 RepID=A0A1N7CIV7_9NOCA|nr:(Fe-S)-binding protein [Williamsia sterculiae]SIR63490.1 Fe-S oxidoreductase [Williamsia sterculiae]